eukprot:421967-Prymnesium_polylepis.1
MAWRPFHRSAFTLGPKPFLASHGKSPANCAASVHRGERGRRRRSSRADAAPACGRAAGRRAILSRPARLAHALVENGGLDRAAAAEGRRDRARRGLEGLSRRDEEHGGQHGSDLRGRGGRARAALDREGERRRATAGKAVDAIRLCSDNLGSGQV